MADTTAKLERLRKLADGSAEVPGHSAIDPADDLFFAIARVELNGEFEIEPGIMLQPTYAHVFAHPMLATSEPINERAPHPAPWQIVESPGMVETATVQLTLARRNDRNNIVFASNLISLMRLVAGSPIRAPIYSNVAFSEIANAADVAIRQFEAPLDWPIHAVLLGEGFLRELRSLLNPLQLMIRDDQFGSAFALSNTIWWLPSLSAQMITIWAAAEALMRPDRKDMTKELARLIRAYSGTSRGDGDNLYQRVTYLCRARGEAAHAGKQPKSQDVQESYFILRALLLRALVEGAPPGSIDNIKPLWS